MHRVSTALQGKKGVMLRHSKYGAQRPYYTLSEPQFIEFIQFVDSTYDLSILEILFRLLMDNYLKKR